MDKQNLNHQGAAKQFPFSKHQQSLSKRRETIHGSVDAHVPEFIRYYAAIGYIQ